MRTSTRLDRLPLLLVLLISLPLTPVHGQGTGRIVGRVVDAEQGDPIAGAQLEVIGTTLTTTSALDGRYSFQSVARFTTWSGAFVLI